MEANTDHSRESNAKSSFFSRHFVGLICSASAVVGIAARIIVMRSDLGKIDSTEALSLLTARDITR